ncbi:HPr kinase/phosphorylase [Paenibacillus mendelii]|uniref:HPr kinase/phosphorylase n=1 Tax=Paenibacillus mendelii TaxID=206163 RepID=A0ABV6JID1_9BACL|nr:aldolase [Paenibacillus mendelii]MCQ6558448.1 aldolase [Paenibacillus mendelii]
MISVAQQTEYRAFGLRISSEIPLPELPVSVDVEERANADIVIEAGVPDRLWVQLESAGSNFARIDNRFLFLIPETAFYCIEDGRKITVSPLAGADPEKVRVYLLGPCMDTLLMIRNTLPLHGSAVEIDGKAYAFLGDSGAGKSTLAAAFVSEGHRLISDDVIAVTLAGDGGMPVVAPSYPQQKLWRECLDLGMSMERGNYRPGYREIAKYAEPVATRVCDGPIPFEGAFELVKSQAEAVSVRPLPNLERLGVMLLHTYRNRRIRRLGLEQWHFKVSEGIAKQMKGYQLNRPLEGVTANRLVSEIIQTIREGEEDK